MDFEVAKEKYQEPTIKGILEKLEEPFDPDLIYWKPQAISKSIREGNRCCVC